MQEFKAERYLDLTQNLGEGPVWDEKTGTLYFVDIEGKALWAHSTATGQNTRLDFPGRVGMCCLKRDGGLVAAVERELMQAREDAWETMALVEADLPDNRFNDGQVDPAGRLLIGTMDTKGQKGRGSLYSVEEGQPPRRLLGDISISNGLGFSPDGRKLYYVDTPSGHLWRFDYDVDSGDITNRVPLIDYTGEEGDFDGLCVDSEGCLWVAHWGGRQVSRWDPATGRKIGRVDVPAALVTSCCFTGEGLDTLVITTARGWDEGDIARWPLSGSLFAVRPGVVGRKVNRFGGAGA